MTAAGPSPEPSADVNGSRVRAATGGSSLARALLVSLTSRFAPGKGLVSGHDLINNVTATAVCFMRVWVEVHLAAAASSKPAFERPISMDDGRLEQTLANIAELQAIVDDKDDTGWDDVHEEISWVHALLCEKESFCKSAGTDSDRSELLELRDRLKELEAEREEEDEQGRAWAESVKIVVRPIDRDDVERGAVRHLRSLGVIREASRWDLQNYCRHNCTNYESLLREGESVPGSWYEVLRGRIHALVEQHLEAVDL
jgi:hypothetical protein